MEHSQGSAATRPSRLALFSFSFNLINPLETVEPELLSIMLRFEGVSRVFAF